MSRKPETLLFTKKKSILKKTTSTKMMIRGIMAKWKHLAIEVEMHPVRNYSKNILGETLAIWSAFQGLLTALLHSILYVLRI